MVEASESLPKYPPYVLLTLARQSARNAVKQQLRAQGLRPQYMRASEINRAADLYLKANARDFFEEAWRKCQGCPDLMRFYEREMKDRERTLRLRAQKQFTKPCPAGTSVERNSCTEWSSAVTIKGYARVSTDGQDLATQHELLRDAGATQVFSEKEGGASAMYGLARGWR